MHDSQSFGVCFQKQYQIVQYWKQGLTGPGNSRVPFEFPFIIHEQHASSFPRAFVARHQQLYVAF